MRDCLNNRGGFDRVLMAVAATFITVSATSAMAQQPSRSTAAELAIDAAIPRPEPANVPPPTAADFKLDTTASTTPSAPVAAKPAEALTAPAPVTPDNAALAPAVPLGATPATTPAAPPAPVTATAPSVPPATDASTASAPEATPAPPAAEPVKAASSVAPADQPVADRLKDQLASKTQRYFDRKAAKSAV